MPAIAQAPATLTAKAQQELGVALIAPAWPAGRISNGITTYASELHREFSRRGANCIVLSNQFEAPASTDWVAKFRPRWLRYSHWINAVARRSANLLPIVRPEIVSLRSAIAALHARRAIDAVEMEESFGNPARIAPGLGVPLVVRLHGPWFLTNDTLSGNEVTARRIAAEKRGIEAAAGVSAPSSAVLNAVRDYYQLELENAAVIPNPIAPAAANERWDARTAAPQTVLFVGRFDSLKGGDTMLLAFDKVLQTMPAAKLQFIGMDDGIASPRGEKQFIREFMAERLSPLAQRQIEALGRLPANQIDDYRRNARVVVVASRYETFSYTAAEAMRLGCPTIASAVGGIPEVIDHERTGLLFKAAETTELAACIVRLLQEQVLGAQFGAAAARHVEQTFHPKIVADQTLEFYQQVIARFKRLHGR